MINQKEEFRCDDKYLYHYTSQRALYSLLQTLKDGNLMFRATHIQYFSDTREYVFFESKLEDELVQYIRKYHPEVCEKDIIGGIKYLFLKNIFVEPSVVSLCKRRNDFYMWYSYGSEGKGVCFEFDKAALRTYAANIGVSLDDCLYVSEKENYFSEEQLKYIYNYLEYISRNHTRIPCLCNLLSYLHTLCITKSSDYELENECRLIVQSSNYKKRKRKYLYVDVGIPISALRGVIIGPKVRGRKRVISQIKSALVMALGVDNARKIKITVAPKKQ